LEKTTVTTTEFYVGGCMQFPCTSTGGRYINPLTFLHTCKDMHVQANMLGCHNTAFQPHASSWTNAPG